MTLRTLEALRSQTTVISSESAEKANRATRVGGAMRDMVDYTARSEKILASLVPTIETDISYTDGATTAGFLTSPEIPAGAIASVGDGLICRVVSRLGWSSSNDPVFHLRLHSGSTLVSDRYFSFRTHGGISNTSWSSGMCDLEFRAFRSLSGGIKFSVVSMLFPGGGGAGTPVGYQEYSASTFSGGWDQALIATMGVVVQEAGGTVHIAQAEICGRW